MPKPTAVPTTIAPWLSVRNAGRAVDFYKSAFGATEAFRMGRRQRCRAPFCGRCRILGWG